MCKLTIHFGNASARKLETFCTTEGIRELLGDFKVLDVLPPQKGGSFPTRAFLTLEDEAETVRAIDFLNGKTWNGMELTATAARPQAPRSEPRHTF